MVFKKDSVIERIKKLEQVLGQLKEKETIELEEYRTDQELQWIIERGLEIASSLIFDIGNHILAGFYKTSVDEYEKVLEKLQEKNVISRKVYAALKGLGGFRNVLGSWVSQSQPGAGLPALQGSFGDLSPFCC